MAWGEAAAAALLSLLLPVFLLRKYLVFLRELLKLDCPTKPLEEMCTFAALEGRSEVSVQGQLTSIDPNTLQE